MLKILDGIGRNKQLILKTTEACHGEWHHVLEEAQGPEYLKLLRAQPLLL